jgi:diacylglycerol kinase (ATP)
VRELAYKIDTNSSADTIAETVPLIVPGTDMGRPIRVGVITNPRSWRNTRRRTRNALREILAAHPHVAEREEDSLDGLLAATRDVVADGAEVIAINGGDGTVQAVLTALLNSDPPERLPLLAVLCGGTTNTTARSTGYGGNQCQDLERLLGEAQAGRLSGEVHRHAVLRADFGGEYPIYAMFFGAGAVYHGIRFYREHVESRGLRGQKGALVALAVFIAKIASGKGGELFPPLEMSGYLDGRRLEADRYRGVLVSTMAKQFVGLSPYWGEGPGPVRFSSLGYSPRHILRAIVPILRGRPNALLRPELGYRSENVYDLELQIDSGFTLDGEMFSSPATVMLSGRHAACFLRRGAG